MKRDLELIREILLAVEEKSDAANIMPAEKLDLPGRSIAEINYHLLLLDEAGYLRCIDNSSDNEIRYYVLRLTWEGHEFLDAARSTTNWTKAKSVIGGVGSFTLEIVKKVLADIALQSARSALNLPPG